MQLLLPGQHYGDLSDLEEQWYGFDPSSDDLSGEEADDEDSESSDDGDFEEDLVGNSRTLCSGVGRHVHRALNNLYATRYEAARNTLPRGPAFLPHVLQVLKLSRPDKFREKLRINPVTFDHLVVRLQDDPVFSNNSGNSQISVEEQVAITLYRFGHFGNAASLQSVADWAGYGKGTINLVTRRIMTALLRPDFVSETVRYPTPEEKEQAKAWVEKHSCAAWRDGWCMVDGTLVPLAERPFWYGESYFDRKCNYSLNIQVCPVQYTGSLYVILKLYVGYISAKLAHHRHRIWAHRQYPRRLRLA